MIFCAEGCDAIRRDYVPVEIFRHEALPRYIADGPYAADYRTPYSFTPDGRAPAPLPFTVFGRHAFQLRDSRQPVPQTL